MFSPRCNQMAISRFSFILFLAVACTLSSHAQTAVSSYTFIDYQKSIPKITDVLRRKEDTLMKQFQAKGLKWPVKYMYVRSFKYDSQMEVWVKNERNEQFKL